VDVPLGLGSRDIAAAKMSAVTKAVGIVVSESSVVRLFCHGQLVGEIIPELWMMDHASHLRSTVKRQRVGELTVLTPSSNDGIPPDLRASIEVLLNEDCGTHSNGEPDRCPRRFGRTQPLINPPHLDSPV
jgi:hypothetical protein